MDAMLQFLQEADAGADILIIGKHLRPGSYAIGKGSIFVRKWGRDGGELGSPEYWAFSTSLKSVSVDTIVYIDQPPREIERLALERTSGHKSYRTFDLYV
jgi:hypothetical protein